MSRLAFRAALDTPRPLAALALVTLSSATLGITGAVPTPVLALQAALIGAAALLRRAPRAWQQRSSVLGAGLVAIVALAAAGLLAGASATGGLAQVALLAAGLQLLDARPRRSEFLLVALALFQVVLASSLTESLLFPPLLMAFLPTCVWTLLVHTLRSEALEAGDPAAASAAITRGLLAMTVAASVLSLLLALCLFFLLPRMRDSLARTSASPVSSSGFSERVLLGDSGRIRGDSTVMLRVRTLSGTPPAPDDAYWRGLAFDRFDGRAWSSSAESRMPVPGDPTLGVSPGAPRRKTPNLLQRILREPVPAGVLFGPGEVLQIRGATGRLERDAAGDLFAPQTADSRVHYDVSVNATVVSDETLEHDRVAPPSASDPLLALPPLSPRIAEQAAAIVSGARSDLARARAIERWLRENGRYSDVPPRDPPGDLRSPIERFLLGELRGHCEYFATAMVVLARGVGLPSRLVNGFAGGRRNRIGDFVELTASDAHAWVEVLFQEHGWIRFDPTPPDLRLAASSATPSLRERIAELQSALELYWLQNVIGFDRDQQVAVAIQGLHALQRWLRPDLDAGDESATDSRWIERLRDLPAQPLLALACVVLGLAAAAIARRVRRARAVPAPLPRSYARALRLLARRGWERSPSRTPRAFAREIGTALGPVAGDAFTAITETYLAERYGGRPRTACAAELRVLRDSLRS